MKICNEMNETVQGLNTIYKKPINQIAYPFITNLPVRATLDVRIGSKENVVTKPRTNGQRLSLVKT